MRYPPATTATFAAFVVFWFASSAVARLPAEIRNIIEAAGLRQTKIAMLAVDLDTGEELVAFNVDEPMIPASNMKLITTAGALHILGPEFIFRTELRLIQPNDWPNPNEPSANELDTSHGRVLVIHGDGDPGFCDPKLMDEHNLDLDQLLRAWVQAVADTGVTAIESLLVDDRVFDNQWTHPTWPEDQLNQWYCAQVAGLNFYTNCLEIFPEPTQLGESPRITVFPNIPTVKLRNRAVTGSTDTFWISRKPASNQITFWGKVKHRASQPTNVTLHDPGMQFGQLFAQRLAQAGIQVQSIGRPRPDQHLPAGKPLFAVQTTLPLILKRCNKDSQNLFAEALLKRMGRKVTGSAGSWANGTAAVRIFLRQQFGPRGAAVTIADGSGLSRDNRVSPRLLVDLLYAMHQHPQLGSVFQQSLSIGGRDGTLRKRFKHGFAGQVYAKTGFIDGVSCISGYLVTGTAGADPQAPLPHRDAHTIAFSFLFNDLKPPIYVYKIKNFQDKILHDIDEYLTASVN